MDSFSMDFTTKSEYEYLAIEISYHGQLLCEISMERGADQLDIEFVRNFRLLSEDVVLKFPVIDFERALKEACSSLVEARN